MSDGGAAFAGYSLLQKLGAVHGLRFRIVLVTEMMLALKEGDADLRTALASRADKLSARLERYLATEIVHTPRPLI